MCAYVWPPRANFETSHVPFRGICFSFSEYALYTMAETSRRYLPDVYSWSLWQLYYVGKAFSILLFLPENRLEYICGYRTDRLRRGLLSSFKRHAESPRDCETRRIRRIQSRRPGHNTWHNIVQVHSIRSLLGHDYLYLNESPFIVHDPYAIQ